VKISKIFLRNIDPVYTVCFAPNGKYLVAAGAAGRLQFWDFKKVQTFLYRYAFGPGAWLDLLPDGRFDASPEGPECPTIFTSCSSLSVSFSRRQWLARNRIR
jgi:WD40 repeat protein